MAHSPIPWRFEKFGVDEERIISADGACVHIDTAYYPSGLTTEDAKFIVQSVNRLNELELALHRIAGHGNITGDKARAIAAEVLSIPVPE